MKSYAVVKFRLFFKLLFVAFAMVIIYLYFDRVSNYEKSEYFVIVKDTIVALGLLAFSCITFFAQMKIDSNGIHHVIGLVRANGKVIGRDMLKTWDEFGIVIFNRKPFLAVALHENDLPFLWWFMMSGLESMLMIVGKYGMDAVVKEKDREYLSDLIKSE